MPTVEDLGKLVKAKYPAYQKLSDVEVGEKVRAKYPNQYGSFAGMPKEKEVSGFGKFIHAAGESIASAFSPANIASGLSDLGLMFSGSPAAFSDVNLRRKEEAFKRTEEAALLPLREAQRGAYAEAAGHAVGMAAPYVAGEIGGRVLGKVLPKGARTLYEAELKPPAKLSLPERSAIVERALEPGNEVPITEEGAESLRAESSLEKEKVTAATSGIYGAASIDIEDVLAPARSYIAKIKPASPRLAAALQKTVADWSKELGHEPDIPETRATVRSSLVDEHGRPITYEKVTSAKQGQTTTTVARLQTLKESLNRVISKTAYSEGRKPGPRTELQQAAAGGAKRAIEDAIPDEPIRAINERIHTDLQLKDAITTAIKRQPGWLSNFAPFILGYAAESAFRGHFGTMGEGLLAGLVVRGAVRNRATMSRLAISLNRVGVKAPKLGGPLGLALGTAGTAAITQGQQSTTNP